MNGVFFPVSNFHGTPYIMEYGGKYYLCLPDWRDTDEIEVSKEFYDACIKEFQSK